MDGLTGLPEAWTVWSHEADRIVLAYQPDVFDSQNFPAACLPTIYLTHGRRDRRPGIERTPRPDSSWYVTLLLEPEVERESERFDSHERALAGAIELAEHFADGEIAYRDLYQVPRPEYLDCLDELTGRDAND